VLPRTAFSATDKLPSRLRIFGSFERGEQHGKVIHAGASPCLLPSIQVAASVSLEEHPCRARTWNQDRTARQLVPESAALRIHFASFSIVFAHSQTLWRTLREIRAALPLGSSLVTVDEFLKKA